ncbi:uncharacterized protein EV420DRAFT_1650728 [Desarmillaria tabescens]|uniref:Heterokaryon incompatibility domain-containing protein n=1 Tax=Armillaria tabescens TaxID=1929756 RepID=A0AA39JDE5_ARMTA|nr:uncharacterized protein EV420DRAFT_1650728 [Desarmillaria tabescens]KAK0439962.1 hypothetical protein EV420DRAFT_1650728 [Desarmillaria tabescens]
MPVIQSALADTRCAYLSMNGVLKELNAILGTSYTLNHPVLPSVLESFIRQDYDFGTLYAHDRERREYLVMKSKFPDSRKAYPRRVWDLYANRVLPCWVPLDMCPSPISHAWVSDDECIEVWTPINGYEWPVPIPKDTDLNLVRIELLNLGMEYVWLDVLCLRQKGGQREDLHREEWKIDVPTIGAVYLCTRVVYYLNGLGRPFFLKSGDLKSDRSWFRRAWMLQEASNMYIIAGESDVHQMDAKMQRIVDRRLKSLQDLMFKSVFLILQNMQNRVSTNPWDRVTGLAYPLCQKFILIYNEDESEEDAWGSLVDAMRMEHHAGLLFIYPEPGNGRKCWRPSWDQIMKM